MTEVQDKISTQRIDIVDEDGKLRLSISNKSQMPAGTMDGIEIQPPGGRGPGMLFFNDDGDECGGIVWGGSESAGGAGAGFFFDRFKQDQTVGLVYNQGNGTYTSGLQVWDRPSVNLRETVDEIKKVREMPDGPDKQSKMEEIAQGHAVRLFAGRDPQGSSTISLNDSKGRPRIVLYVGSDDEPHIEVRDSDGKVVKTLL